CVSPDQLDLVLAREILDADHAHLDKIKDRILEFLGVRKLRQDSRGPILCFVGPPGVGKTSLGRSIARSMGREFVRVSLGGVRDEAEVRGHRRTYVGALPGRIIQGVKQAGTRNPVFMLDEIDKLGADYRGDPSSALLEVLDPEQNSNFSDHYLNVAFDLSSAFFIATANQLDPIPGPLRDRMEIVRLSGYTPEEKTEIAKSYLIPRQTEEAGLPDDRIHWSEPALVRVVTEYTAEAGVRNLERQIATVCRKIARRTAEGDESQLKLTRKNLATFLGPAPYVQETIIAEPQVGVATGLAWTEAGGDVLSIEAAMTKGKGIVLTGQLGDVMKESGHAALTWVRAQATELGIEDKVLGDHQIHVHVPAGAIPKDGPSAGVTMATAITSLATGVAIRSDVAMTGEVTLSGRVLPVGGVREKALAALRNGIHTVILPKKNLDDLEELPREAKRKLTFIPVAHMTEVLKVALEPTKPRRRRGRSAGPQAPAQAKLKS
ncbi:MAG: endopeptidase La, partial [Deltaproteobacteria bacterium]|nr:endopeptidase La [Deltaproteobacteria bacterium]